MNINSPKYLIEANKQLLIGNFSQAIELCSNGVERYPEYVLGYILLAEAYELSGDKESAGTIFDGAKDIFPTNKMLKLISKRFSNSEKYSLIQLISLEEKSNIFSRFQNSISQTGFIKPKPEDIPEEIEDLAEQNPEFPPSENIATILTNQGKIAEAIEVYLKLMHQNPGKADFYIEKIDSLKLQIQNG